MAVLCEALSVIVKTRSLNEKLKGGKQEFLKLIPNSTYCSDGELERVGFLSPEEAENYILTLKGKGLEFLQNNESVDIVVTDMLKGPTVSCEWIEFQRITFEEGKISAAWLFEGKRLLGKGAGCIATREEIAKDFVMRNDSQIDFYAKNIVHRMPGNRLLRDGLVNYDKGIYTLTDIFTGLSTAQKSELEAILEKRILDYQEMRNPFGDSNLDAVPGNLRYEVLKRARNRCELCGVSSKETQIDADHILPRSKGGSNDIENLQALCRTCNAQKSNRDDTDFRKITNTYSQRKKGCVFCELPSNRIVEENELAIAFEDGYPVTEGHTLVISKRHVADYFDLYQPERNDIQRLLESDRARTMKRDKSVTGFNIGII